MTIESYVKYLEDFKKFETTREYAKNTMSMPDNLARAYASAVVADNQDMIHRIFTEYKAHGDNATVPEMHRKSKEQELHDAFVEGFSKTSW